MKSIITVLVFAQMLSAQAFAGTYVCMAQESSEYKDAAIVFNAQTETLTQTSKDAIIEDGLEEALVDALNATDVKVMTARCPHCYTVSGTIMGAYDLTLNIAGKSGNFKVDYGDSSSDAPNGELDCEFIK